MDWSNVINCMTPDEKIGQLLCTYINDEDEVFDMACRGILGALYTNTPGKTIDEAANWINRIQETAKYPLLLCEDFEEGIKKFGTWLPTFMGIGATHEPVNACKAGSVAGRELKALGYGLIGSPVVDINTNPKNPIINTRSFGRSPGLVSDMAVSYIKAVQNEGLIATCKHFPGHGDSSLDSHRELPVLEHGMERLEAIELAPYRNAIKIGAKAIMTSHIVVPAVENDIRLPATLSRNVLTGLLREKMGFKGLIVSDAMAMWAITKNFSTDEWASLAIEAGIDILIVSYPMEAFKAVKKAVMSGKISMERIDESVKRIIAYKGSVLNNKMYPLDVSRAKSIIGSEEHAKIAEEIASAGVTCTGDGVNLEKIREEGGKILLLTLTNSSRKYHDGVYTYSMGVPGRRASYIEASEEFPGDSVFYDSGLSVAKLLKSKLGESLDVVHYCGQDKDWLAEKANKAGCIVINISVINQSYNENSAKLPDDEKEICRMLLKTPCKKVILSTGNPYAVCDLSGQNCTVFTYSLCKASLDAAVRGLTGEMQFRGKVPF